jgi:hypothetical protein
MTMQLDSLMAKGKHNHYIIGLFYSPGILGDMNKE